MGIVLLALVIGIPAFMYWLAIREWRRSRSGKPSADRRWMDHGETKWPRQR